MNRHICPNGSFLAPRSSASDAKQRPEGHTCLFVPNKCIFLEYHYVIESILPLNYSAFTSAILKTNAIFDRL